MYSTVHLPKGTPEAHLYSTEAKLEAVRELEGGGRNNRVVTLNIVREGGDSLRHFRNRSLQESQKLFLNAINEYD